MAYQRMKRLAMILSESRRFSRKITLGQAMIEAGYSPSTAIKPSQVTKSKSWRDLMDELLPEDKMLDKLKQNATQNRSIHGSNAALDMFFRLRGKYQKEQPNEEEVLDLDEVQKENERLKSKLYARRTTN